jgi:primosomal protein N' (replication factor Y)
VPAKSVVVDVVVDRVTRGLDRPLTYVADPEPAVRPGTRVRVPLGSRIVTGFVVAVRETDELAPTWRSIDGVVDPDPLLPEDLVALAFWMREEWTCLLPQAFRTMVPAPVRRAPTPDPDRLYPGPDRPTRGPVRQRLWDYVAEHPGLSLDAVTTAVGGSRAVLRAMLDVGQLVWGERPPEPVALAPHALTPAQEQAAAALRLASPGSIWLLEGVTGSGKTEVYLDVIAATLARGQQAIVLLPEISLTEEMRRRYERRLPGRVAVFHSGMADGERVAEWHRVRRGVAPVVLGARSAVFAPCPRLGLVIIDEEHETSYKQDEHPHYHARDVAEARIRHGGGVLVLGSATPSLETAQRARSGVIGWLRLPERVSRRPLPDPVVVDMRRELADGHREMFSRPLKQALTEVLARGEQALLFLNRRGFATVVVCRDCGQPVRCPDCAVSLTWHREEDRLLCHYCSFAQPTPRHCPACGSARIRAFGAGTEQVVAEVERHWPAARVVRADADALRLRGSHQRLFEGFRRGGADVMVGTQLIAKGMDWPRVTLVGVVAADLSLTLPDFRAAERTFQLITQAAGRAGRGERPGRVVIQTYNAEHYAVRAAAAQDFSAFFAAELPFRRQLRYPPFAELLLVEAAAPTAEAARALAIRARQAVGDDDALTVLGPAPAPLEKVRGRFRYHLLVKAPDRERLRRLARQIADLDPDLRATLDPQAMM